MYVKRLLLLLLLFSATHSLDVMPYTISSVVWIRAHIYIHLTTTACAYMCVLWLCGVPHIRSELFTRGAYVLVRLHENLSIFVVWILYMCVSVSLRALVCVNLNAIREEKSMYVCVLDRERKTERVPPSCCVDRKFFPRKRVFHCYYTTVVSSQATRTPNSSFFVSSILQFYSCIECVLWK